MCNRMVNAMPSGEDYRYLYVILYNKGKGYRLSNTENDHRSLKQVLVDEGYEIIYEPTGDRDIIVGKKTGELIGVADLWGPWAIDLNEKIDTNEPPPPMFA